MLYTALKIKSKILVNYKDKILKLTKFFSAFLRSMLTSMNYI